MLNFDAHVNPHPREPRNTAFGHLSQGAPSQPAGILATG
jgi:hypothetical protein